MLPCLGYLASPIDTLLTMAVEALVRELHALGVALRERDEELRERTDRLDALAGDVSVEREM